MVCPDTCIIGCLSPLASFVNVAASLAFCTSVTRPAECRVGGGMRARRTRAPGFELRGGVTTPPFRMELLPGNMGVAGEGARTLEHLESLLLETAAAQCPWMLFFWHPGDVEMWALGRSPNGDASACESASDAYPMMDLGGLYEVQRVARSLARVTSMRGELPALVVILWLTPEQATAIVKAWRCAS